MVAFSTQLTKKGADRSRRPISREDTLFLRRFVARNISPLGLIDLARIIFPGRAVVGLGVSAFILTHLGGSARIKEHWRGETLASLQTAAPTLSAIASVGRI